MRREYHYSDWQKHLTFENFQRGRDAYYYYYQNPGKAFQDSYQGAEKESIMWARIYSEDVLHRLFEPIPDFMVLDKLDAARDTNNLSVFWKFFVGLGIQQFLSSDKGFGGGSRFSWTFGAGKSQQKWVNQMVRRGWTPSQIEEAILFGEQYSAINFANGNPATRYVHPETGRSVVIDDITYEVIHIGGDNFVY